MAEQASDNEVEEETRSKKTPVPKRKTKKAEKKNPSKKCASTHPSEAASKRIRRKRVTREASGAQKPKKIVHLMIYPFQGLVL